MTILPMIIFIHIAAGSVGLVSGAAALIVGKGNANHRMTGNLFFVSMIIMSLLSSIAAWFKPEMISVLNGMLTAYLVATAWMTVRRKPGVTGSFDIVALLVISTIAIVLFTLGVRAASSETGLEDGFPAGPYYFFGSIAALSAGLDIRVILRGGCSGIQRITRHLWRMCIALFIAAASFFTGQPQLFPEPLQRTEILLIPPLTVIVLMIFWMIRIRFFGRGNSLFSTSLLKPRNNSSNSS